MELPTLDTVFAVHPALNSSVEGIGCLDEKADVLRTTVEALQAMTAPRAALKFHPMLCMRMSTFMRLEIMPPYEDMLRCCDLEQPEKGSVVHFISHQWLSFNHPDPHGVHLRRAQDVFGEMSEGRAQEFFASSDWEMVAASTGSDREFSKQVSEGFVWLDFCCMPQVHQEGTDVHAILSMRHFLQRATYFWILCPTAAHEDLGTQCNFTTYRHRGWCRFEELGNFLSLRPATPLIVTDAPKLATYSWHDFLIDNIGRAERAPCRGQFSCCQLGHKVGLLPGRCDKCGIAQVLRVLFHKKVCSVRPKTQLSHLLAGMELTIFAGAEAFLENLITQADETEENFVSSFGIDETALFRAAVLAGHKAIVTKFLQQDIWATDQGPLHVMAMGADRSIVEVFVRSGRLEEHVNLFCAGVTALHRAAELGRADILLTLLQHCALVDLKTREPFPPGRTALHQAALRGHYHCCEVLLDHRASVNSQDTRESTALHMAVTEPLHVLGNQVPGAKENTLQVLLAARADLCATDGEGRTPTDLVSVDHAAHGLLAVIFLNAKTRENDTTCEFSL